MPRQHLSVRWKEEGNRPLATTPELDAALAPNLLTVHLWGPRFGVRCHLRTFRRYWSDFWYPSDENTVLLVPRVRIRIEHIEEQVYFSRIATP